MKKISEKILYKGNWLLFKESTFLSQDGKEIKWEIIERKHKSTVLIIIAKLLPSNRYVLLRQYRPAINNYIIGFPAGVSDDNIKEEALKELKEETGYTGKIISISPILKTNPGIMNINAHIVKAEINEEDPLNANPKQSLEPSEEIEVILKRKEEIMEFLKKEKERGCDIGIGIWYVFGIK
jgi:ADP-ribose pyrophosphatase